MTASILFSKPCDECGGTGLLDVERDEYGRQTGAQEEWCSSCVGGWLPDDDTVEAAASGLFPHDVRTVLHHDWTGRGIERLAVTLTRRALVAAARYQAKANT